MLDFGSGSILLEVSATLLHKNHGRYVPGGNMGKYEQFVRYREVARGVPKSRVKTVLGLKGTGVEGKVSNTAQDSNFPIKLNGQQHVT